MKKNVFIKIIVICVLLSLTSGCDIIDKIFGKPKEAAKPVLTPVSSVEEDEKVKAMIVNFYTRVFAMPVSDSYSYNVRGIVPDKIESLILKETVDEKGGTTEFPIHYPRFVEINGLTICGYEVLKNAAGPRINARFYEEKSNGKVFAYYVDIDLRAKVIKNDDFPKYFRYNSNTKLVEKTEEIPESEADYIKINARYDVYVTRSGAVDYKIESAMEATAKQNLYRLNKINNDFIKRITFLDQKNPDEKSVFTAETNFLKDYFKNMMTLLDKEKTMILGQKWKNSARDFANFLNANGILKNLKGESYYYDILNEDTYKKRFDIKSFPIRSDIQKIKSVEITVNEHPGFTEKKRAYRLYIVATVDKNEGKISSDSKFAFEYSAVIKRDIGKILIDSFNLNQYNMIRAEVKPKKAKVLPKATDK